MNLNKRLIEWRKGYWKWIKTRYTIKNQLFAIKDDFIEAITVLGKFILTLIISIFLPVLFFPFSFIDYKMEYKRLKKRFADFGINLTDDYQPKDKINKKELLNGRNK